MTDFNRWLTEFARPDRVWYTKRLSGNDTLANGSHQAGPYIPRDFLNSRFPSLNRPDVQNPDVWFDLFVDSHSERRQARAVWYNGRLHGKTRNESRLTNLGGVSSPLLDPENTGALVIFAFRRVERGDAPDCRVWICRDETEEESAEDLIGAVEPAQTLIWSPEHGRISEPALAPVGCWLEPADIPFGWMESFPSGAEILRKAVELSPGHRKLDPDDRLLARRDCEYQVFRSLEEAIELPGIRAGFDSVDQFVARAQSVLQRRKVRSGRSLELHVRQIFREEGFTEGRHFAHGVDSEPGNKPDFLFPSQAHYRDPGFPEVKLRMPEIAPVPLPVPVQLRLPELPIRLRHVGERAAFMPVPEAASDLHHGPVFREYDVRPSRKVTAVKSKPEPQAMQKAAYDDLGLRVLPPDRGHHGATSPGIDDIGQSGCPERRGRLSWFGFDTLEATWGAISRAMASTTGTATAFPNCL